MKRVSLLIASLLCAGFACAQSYPAHAVKVVVPWPPGQATDLPGFDVGAWIGYSAPAGTPREVLARLSGEIQKAMQAQDLRQRYLALGLDPVANTPDEMTAFLRTEQARYGEIVRKANIRVE